MASVELLAFVSAWALGLVDLSEESMGLSVSSCRVGFLLSLLELDCAWSIGAGFGACWK